MPGHGSASTRARTCTSARSNTRAGGSFVHVHGIRRNRRSRGSRRWNIPRYTQKPSIPWEPARRYSTGCAETADPVEAGEGIFHGIRKNRRSRGSLGANIPWYTQKPSIPWKSENVASTISAKLSISWKPANRESTISAKLSISWKPASRESAISANLSISWNSEKNGPMIYTVTHISWKRRNREANRREIPTNNEKAGSRRMIVHRVSCPLLGSLVTFSPSYSPIRGNQHIVTVADRPTGDRLGVLSRRFYSAALLLRCYSAALLLRCYSASLSRYFTDGVSWPESCQSLSATGFQFLA